MKNLFSAIVVGVFLVSSALAQDTKPGEPKPGVNPADATPPQTKSGPIGTGPNPYGLSYDDCRNERDTMEIWGMSAAASATLVAGAATAGASVIWTLVFGVVGSGVTYRALQMKENFGNDCGPFVPKSPNSTVDSTKKGGK